MRHLYLSTEIFEFLQNVTTLTTTTRRTTTTTTTTFKLIDRDARGEKEPLLWENKCRSIFGFFCNILFSRSKIERKKNGNSTFNVSGIEGEAEKMHTIYVGNEQK